MAPAQSSPTSAARIGRAAARWLHSGRAPVRSAPPQGGVGRALGRASRRLVAHAGNVAARLGLQMAAVLFLLFGLSFSVAGVSGWRAEHRSVHSGNLTNMSSSTELEFLLAALFLYFAVSSLFRASARR